MELDDEDNIQGRNLLMPAGTNQKLATAKGGTTSSSRVQTPSKRPEYQLPLTEPSTWLNLGGKTDNVETLSMPGTGTKNPFHQRFKMSHQSLSRKLSTKKSK
jgi:hypothetical protein